MLGVVKVKIKDKKIRGKYVTRIVCFFTVVIIIFSCLSGNLTKSIFVFGGLDRLVPIYRVQTDEKIVSISFDAAWGSDITPKLLEILKRHETKTTFFLVKFWMEKYPEMTRKIAAEGHEIGNHSATHPKMGSLSKEAVIKEIQSTHQKIKELTGMEANLFRPPFGDYGNLLITTCAELNYHVIQWDVDSLDWKDLSASAIHDRVMKRIKPGSIVLFHNNGKHTAEALEMILHDLRRQGYKIIPISQLLIKGDYFIDKSTGEMRRK